MPTTCWIYRRTFFRDIFGANAYLVSNPGLKGVCRIDCWRDWWDDAGTQGQYRGIAYGHQKKGVEPRKEQLYINFLIFGEDIYLRDNPGPDSIDSIHLILRRSIRFLMNMSWNTRLIILPSHMCKIAKQRWYKLHYFVPKPFKAKIII